MSKYYTQRHQKLTTELWIVCRLSLSIIFAHVSHLSKISRYHHYIPCIVVELWMPDLSVISEHLKILLPECLIRDEFLRSFMAG
jgi:hypothetical protein